MEVQFIFPHGMFGSTDSDSGLDACLRKLAIKFSKSKGEWPDKYGTDFDNAKFMMHRYCWCEQSDCVWCSGCECKYIGKGVEWYVDGKRVTHKKYESVFQFYFKRTVLPHTVAEHGTKEYRAASNIFETLIKERDGRLSSIFCGIVHKCKPAGMMQDMGRINPRDKMWKPGFPDCGHAPNFWHKETGLKVWWYKYIGRDMKANKPFKPDDLKAIFRDCMARSK